MRFVAPRRQRVGLLPFLLILVPALLAGVFPGSTAAAEPMRVTPTSRVTQSVSVRSDPTTDGSQILAHLTPGQSATVLESLPGWFHVRLDSGRKGFVSKRWVRAAGGTPFRLHMVDVGVGDGLIVDMGDAEILIDGGMHASAMREYNDSDPADTTDSIIQWPIELAIVTHADSDHWKGMQALLATPAAAAMSKPVLEFWEPGYSRSCDPLESYDQFIASMPNRVSTGRFRRPLARTHRPAVVTGEPEPIAVPGLPGVRITVLHADEAPPDEGSCAFQINDASIVLLLEVGGVRFLLTGDANGKLHKEDATVTPSHVEAKLLDLERRRPGVLRADVLKVPHHGSETASTKAFIDAVSPTFAIISASTTHHLPKPTVVRRYEESDIVVLSTDRTPKSKNDPILCLGSGTGDVDCNFADELE